MSEKVTLTFNGREIETDAGKPIIGLSQELGEEIPHFCYHPGIGVDGNCRMCLVELEGVPKLVTACTLTAAEGMKITSNSEKVIKAREGVLEFILINHPLDCPICDKGGECPLQEITREHGPAHSRMADGKNHNVKHKIIGEHIIFDAERCILCSRCVRFQRDVVGREELGIEFRGDRATITLFGDSELTSGFTGNLADICPVGALTTRAFRFQARPWEMRRIETSCGACSLGCSMGSWWKDGELMRLTGEPDAGVNGWWLCDRGRFEYPDHAGENENLVKRQGVQVPVGRQEAVAHARELLGGGNAAVLAGSRTTDEELAAVKRLGAALGGRFSPFPVSGALRDFIAALDDTQLELEDLSELERFDRVLVLGQDPELGHPVFGLRLAGSSADGRQSVTAVQAGDWAPRSDVTRRWRRVEAEAAPWLEGEGAAELGGEDALLVAVDESQLRAGGLDRALLERLGARAGTTRVLVLLGGMNRRGLAAAATAAAGDDLLAGLESGKVEHLLVFGLDPVADLDEPERWERALGKADGLILQGAGPAGLRSGATVVLARRAPVDLAGSFTNTFGARRALASWQPVAGLRQGDADWFEPLVGDAPAARDSMEVAGSHEG